MLKWILLIVILAVIALIFIIAVTVQRKMFRKFHIETYSSLEHFDDYRGHYHRTPVSFLSGKNRLKGFLYAPDLPESEIRGLIVFSHGIWSGPEEYLMMLLWFVEHGYAVFTYNNTAYNGSGGKWARGLYQSPLDLDAALTYIESNRKLAAMPRFLLGHSWGGFAVTAVLNFPHKVDGVISLSGFDRPMKITMSVARSMFGPIAGVFTLPMKLINRILFGRNVKLNAVDGINATDAPVLLVHGREDDFIYYDTLSILSQKSRITNPGLETLTLEGQKHNTFFLSPESEAYSEKINQRFEEEVKEIVKKDQPLFRKDYFSKIDKKRANVPNEELYIQLLSFLENCSRE